MNINYAIVSAFERSKVEGKRRHSSTRTFTVLLMAVFFMALMGGLASGVLMYKHVSDVQAQVNEAHLQSGLLANVIHVNDSVFSVSEGEGPEGKSLVLVEEINGNPYETRIYQFRGYIVQEYAVGGHPYAPERATRLFKSQTFDFQFDGKLLTMTCDQGSFDVALRSRQGGAQ